MWHVSRSQIARQYWVPFRYAQAKLNFNLYALKFHLWVKKSGQISKKNFFFANFHEFSKYRKIFKCDLKKNALSRISLKYSSFERGDKSIRIWKNLGGGGRKRVKFRFEVSVSKKMGFLRFFHFHPSKIVFSAQNHKNIIFIGNRWF